jgi:two-component SAPR family response regulator
MVSRTQTKRKLAGCRILVVEDDYFIADTVGNVLKDIGCDVIGPFSSIEDTIQEIGDDLPDAAVLDVNLQGRTVYPLAQALMQRKIPVLFVTGYDHSTIHRKYRSVPHLAKPVDANRLQNAVARLILDPRTEDAASEINGVWREINAPRPLS